MFSYTSAIAKKWLAIVSHGLKRDNIRNPFRHSFRRSFRHFLTVYIAFLWGPFGPVFRGWARNASKESSKSSQSWPNFIPSRSF
jgi:hypothetical protein